jgi:hypothetical protein
VADAALIGPAVERCVRLFQTVHRNIAAIDPVGARRSKERDHVRHFFGSAQPAHRKTVSDVVLVILRIGEAVAVPAVALDQYRTG